MAESGDTYSNEGDSYAPEGMGDDPGSLEHAQKLGTYAMRRRQCSSVFERKVLAVFDL